MTSDTTDNKKNLRMVEIALEPRLLQIADAIVATAPPRHIRMHESAEFVCASIHIDAPARAAALHAARGSDDEGYG